MFCAPLILAESHSLANQFLVCYPANRRALKFHFNPFFLGTNIQIFMSILCDELCPTAVVSDISYGRLGISETCHPFKAILI